jgi:hypothetical protein
VEALDLHGLRVESVLVQRRVGFPLDALPDDRRRQSFGSCDSVVVNSHFRIAVKPGEANWVA